MLLAPGTSLDYPNINKNDSMSIIRSWAEDGILMRIYAHPNYNLNSATYADIASVLRWISAPKTDGTPENWKATDGEAASYIYSRHTTEIKKNGSPSESGMVTYDIIRQDPRDAGYWLVPVTLDFDIGQTSISEVQVVENGKIYSSLPGHLPLPNLDGKRVMDQGYDIRDGHLYISHFFNDSAQVRLRLNNPYIINEPAPVGLVDVNYVYLAQSTEPNNGSSIWALDNDDTDWLKISFSNDTRCLLEGAPSMPGHYNVSLTVKDNDSQCSINWTIVVGTSPDVEKPVTRLISPIETTGWINTSVTVVLLSTDNWSGVRNTYITIDGGPYKVYTAPFAVLTQGMHSISFYSTDWWGNMSNVTTYQFGIDSTPPQLTIGTKNDALLSKDSAKLVFSASDDISGIEEMQITVDGSPPMVIEDVTSFSLADYSTGEHKVMITAVDKAGNTVSTEIDVRISAITSRGIPSPVFFFLATGLVVILMIVLMIRTTRKR
jgi:hypothetical protein